MSDKPYDRINPLDRMIRDTARCGMTDGTVMVIEFVSGFEMFNTRPYHNYESWGQGYHVYGLGCEARREDLDDAIADWSAQVKAKRGEPSKTPWLDGVDPTKPRPRGEPFERELLPDWIKPTVTEEKPA